MNQNPEIEKLNKKAKEYSKMLKGIHAEMSKVIVGQDAVIENLILALATQGHVLLKGVPGLAKTLLIKTLADCMTSIFLLVGLALPLVSRADLLFLLIEPLEELC